jgi:hypothetical protein
MTTIEIPHATDANKVEQVMIDMKELGYPTIRVYNAGDYLIAIEGAHRVTAAGTLGIAINTTEINDDEVIDLDTLDWDDNGWFDDRIVPVNDFIARFTEQRGIMVDCEVA